MILLAQVLCANLCILRDIGVKEGRAKAPHILMVIWLPPPIVWINVKAYGAACATSGLVSFGGIFRDHFDNFLSWFGASLGLAFSFEA